MTNRLHYGMALVKVHLQFDLAQDLVIPTQLLTTLAHWRLQL
jgi:hypothetical protein